jgi:hypothetical protein
MRRKIQKGVPQPEAGWVEITTPDGQVIRGGCKQCCHCGAVFLSKSSESIIKKFLTPEQAAQFEVEGKTVRGWCFNCMGPICGPRCVECMPEEKLLEGLEKGVPVDKMPIFVPVTYGGPTSHLKGGILIDRLRIADNTCQQEFVAPSQPTILDSSE